MEDNSMEQVSPVGSVGFGVLFLIIGLILATDLLGLATLHVRSSMRTMGPIGRRLDRLPPWRWIHMSPESELAWGRRLNRHTGIAFAAFGTLGIVVGAIRLVAGDS